MRLAVLAGADPLNIRTWSGTPYFMTKTLQTQFPDLLPVRTPSPTWFQHLRRASLKASGGRVDLYWNYSLARWNASHLAACLKAERRVSRWAGDLAPRAGREAESLDRTGSLWGAIGHAKK